MPAARDCSQSEGKPEPASVFLSPVARDYPSRALRGFFMPAALRVALIRPFRHPLSRCPGSSIGRWVLPVA
jgi:hypothetical protein